MPETNPIPVVVITALLIIALFTFGFFSVVIFMKRQQRNAQERAELVFSHQQQMLTARLEEQESIMLQISKDLHDNLTQQLGLLHMNLKGIAESGITPQQQNFVNNCSSITARIANELRNISYSLNSDYIKARGLGEILNREVEYLSASKDISARLTIDGLYRTLPPEKELIIYRIAQEAIHNALKHACAGHISIRLQYGSGFLNLYITDDGIGFNENAPDVKSGLGLRNMRQRAEMLGAELLIDASLGNGCCLLLKVKDGDGGTAAAVTAPRPQTQVEA